MALQPKMVTILTCLLLGQIQFLADGSRTARDLSQGINALQAPAEGDAGANPGSTETNSEVVDAEDAADRKQQELEILVEEARRNLEEYANRVKLMLQSKELSRQVQYAMKAVQLTETWLKSQAATFNVHFEEAAKQYDNKREVLKNIANPIVPLAGFSLEDLQAHAVEVEQAQAMMQKKTVSSPGWMSKIFGTSSHSSDNSTAAEYHHQKPDAFQDLYKALDLSQHSQVSWGPGERHRVASQLADKGITARQWNKALHEAKKPLLAAHGQALQEGRYDHTDKFYKDLAQDFADGVDVGGADGTGIGQVNINYFSLYIMNDKLDKKVRIDLARGMARKGVQISDVETALANSKKTAGGRSPLYQDTSEFNEQLVRDVIAGSGGRDNVRGS